MNKTRQSRLIAAIAGTTFSVAGIHGLIVGNCPYLAGLLATAGWGGIAISLAPKTKSGKEIFENLDLRDVPNQEINFLIDALEAYKK